MKGLLRTVLAVAAVLLASVVIGGASEAQAHDGVQFVGRNRFGQPVFVQSGRQFSRGPVFVQRRGPVFFSGRRRFSRFGGPVFIDDGFGRFGRRSFIGGGFGVQRNFSLFNLQF